MMEMIHGYMNLPPDVRLRECGTQEYEADVVILEQRGKSTAEFLIVPLFNFFFFVVVCGSSLQMEK